MSSVPRIVIHQNFAADFTKAMAAVPHTLRPMKDQNDAEMAALLAETDIFVSGAFKGAWRDPRCAVKLIHCVGAGTDGIDFPGLPAGCTVCNVYGHERGVAEQAFMHMLALHKGLLSLDRNLRQGHWTPSRPYMPELRDYNLLILGLGHIGRELVRFGGFFGMNVTVLTRNADAARAAGLNLKAFGGLDQLPKYLPSADFVVSAVPSAAGTVDLIGAKELALMKPTAFIVNVGRGPVINEEALYNALKDHRIAGAGLDVWWQYPALGQNREPSRFPYGQLDNVVMTPHKPTFETMTFRWREIALNIQRFVRGEPLVNVVHRG